jgi:DinB superfamily
MKKSDINQPPCYFDKYIDLVDDIEISAAFKQSLDELDNLDLAKFKQIGDAVYAEGKWTVKDILQHLIDSERVLGYRSLCIGRNDPTELPSFDEEIFAANVSTKNKTLEGMIAELKIVRASTALLFESFDDAAMHRSMTIYGNQMCVLAYGFSIIAHQIHHLNIIEERYLPLAETRQ